MKLTRKILTEKSSKFWLYNTPDDVPDELWNIAFNEISEKGMGIDILEYIAGEILSPLVNNKNYEIIASKNLEYLYRDIVFYNSWTFRIYNGVLNDLRLYPLEDMIY